MFGGARREPDRWVNVRETWLLKLHETWVDFGYIGFETGSFDFPFNTLGEGANVAPSGSVVKIKTGARRESVTVSKQLSIQAFGGPVTIGQ